MDLRQGWTWEPTFLYKWSQSVAVSLDYASGVNFLKITLTILPPVLIGISTQVLFHVPLLAPLPGTFLYLAVVMLLNVFSPDVIFASGTRCHGAASHCFAWSCDCCPGTSPQPTSFPLLYSCVNCPVNTFSEEGFSHCESCPPFFYSVPGSKFCTPNYAHPLILVPLLVLLYLAFRVARVMVSVVRNLAQMYVKFLLTENR